MVTIKAGRTGPASLGLTPALKVWSTLLSFTERAMAGRRGCHEPQPGSESVCGSSGLSQSGSVRLKQRQPCLVAARASVWRVAERAAASKYAR